MTSKMLFVSQVFILFVGSVQAAFAADSPERLAIDRSSRASGFGRSTVRLVNRGVRLGAGPTMDSLISASGRAELKAPSAKRTAVAEAVRVEGGGWYLQVKGDGSVAEYYNAEMRNGVPLEARLSDATLTRRASSFAVSNFGAALGLSASDLIPINVRHQIGTFGSRSTSAPEGQKLFSSQVTFARRIDGLPVIGPGSKIHVELSVSGDVVGFSYDWSAISMGTAVQKVHMPKEVLERATNVAGVGNGDLSQIKRFECGYYDAGALAGSAQMQGACLVQTTARDATGLRVDQAFVPAAVAVLGNESWPLAQVLAGRPVPASPEPPSAPRRPR
jgi:hypothetical protein